MLLSSTSLLLSLSLLSLIYIYIYMYVCIYSYISCIHINFDLNIGSDLFTYYFCIHYYNEIFPLIITVFIFIINIVIIIEIFLSFVVHTDSGKFFIFSVISSNDYHCYSCRYLYYDHCYYSLSNIAGDEKKLLPRGRKFIFLNQFNWIFQLLFSRDLFCVICFSWCILMTLAVDYHQQPNFLLTIHRFSQWSMMSHNLPMN